MFMLLCYLLLGIFLMMVGGNKAGLWSADDKLQGIVLVLAGLVLVIAQLMQF